MNWEEDGYKKTLFEPRNIETDELNHYPIPIEYEKYDDPIKTK